MRGLGSGDEEKREKKMSRVSVVKRGEEGRRRGGVEERRSRGLEEEGRSRGVEEGREEVRRSRGED